MLQASPSCERKDLSASLLGGIAVGSIYRARQNTSDAHGFSKRNIDDVAGVQPDLVCSLAAVSLVRMGNDFPIPIAQVMTSVGSK